MIRAFLAACALAIGSAPAMAVTYDLSVTLAPSDFKVNPGGSFVNYEVPQVRRIRYAYALLSTPVIVGQGDIINLDFNVSGSGLDFDNIDFVSPMLSETRGQSDNINSVSGSISLFDDSGLRFSTPVATSFCCHSLRPYAYGEQLGSRHQQITLTKLSADFSVDASSTPPREYSYVYLLIADGLDVPEPASWALMIAGFGLVGASARRSRYKFRPA